MRRVRRRVRASRKARRKTKRRKRRQRAVKEKRERGKNERSRKIEFPTGSKEQPHNYNNDRIEKSITGR